jgi:hypothetical protein
VLKVAPTAAARAGVRARRRHPIRVRRQDFDRVPAAECAAVVFGDPHEGSLARNAVPYEDDPAVIAGYHMSTVGDRAEIYLKFSTLPGNVRHRH